MEVLLRFGRRFHDAVGAKDELFLRSRPTLFEIRREGGLATILPSVMIIYDILISVIVHGVSNPTPSQ